MSTIIDEMVSTGEIIKQYLEGNLLSATELASASGVTLKTISLVLNGKQRISPKVACGLNKLIPEISVNFILDYDKKYQEQQAKVEKKLDLKDLGSKIDYFQLKKFYKKEKMTTEALVQKGTSIFGDGFLKMTMDTGRISPTFCFSKAKNSDDNVSTAWVLSCFYECNAQRIKPLDFNYSEFVKHLPDLHGYCQIGDKDNMLMAMKKFCVDCGINFYFHSSIPNSRVKGITFRSKDKHVYLFISDLFRCVENTWYTFIHECCHIQNNDLDKEIEINELLATQNERYIDKSAILYVLNKNSKAYSSLASIRTLSDLKKVSNDAEAPINMVAEAARFIQNEYTNRQFNQFINNF